MCLCLQRAHHGAPHREHDPSGGGQRQDAPARVRARGRRQHGHQGRPRVVRRHAKVLRSQGEGLIFRKMSSILTAGG